MGVTSQTGVRLVWSPTGHDDMMRACKSLDQALFADNMNIFAEGSNPAELYWEEQGPRGAQQVV